MSKLVEDIKLIIENEDIEDLCSYSYISYDIDVDDINKNENISPRKKISPNRDGLFGANIFY